MVNLIYSTFSNMLSNTWISLLVLSLGCNKLPLNCDGTLPLPLYIPIPRYWKQKPLLSGVPGYGQIPSLQSYLQESLARINPAIEELELESMVPSFPFGDKDVNNVKFYLYTSPTLDIDKSTSESEESFGREQQLMVNDIASVNQSSFNGQNPVKILIHGWSMTVKSKDFPGPIKDAYLEVFGSGKCNVICVDWQAMSREFLYVNSVVYAEKVGRRVGEFIVFLRLAGFIKDFSNIHLVTFSLGAHVGGVAGDFVKKSTGGELVGRITGLDPAGPGFMSVPHSQRLDSQDALFVDVIHTNGGQLINGDFGSPLSSGHADFFPEGGQRQPQCELSLLREYSVPRRTGCHHMKSIDYFLQSIYVPMIACKCRNWKTFVNGGCNCSDKENRAFMGEPCPITARGKYYLHVT